MPTSDLIDQTALAAYLADYGLSDAERALLPTLAAAASSSVRRHCGRDFTLESYDEQYTVRAPDRVVVLNQYPVAQVTRCATGRATVLSVSNTDTATNYRATAALKTAGDAATGLTLVGLTLTRYASGVSYASDLTFGAGPPTIRTVQQLAAQVAALGAGWSATVASGFGGWAVTDLRPVQGVFPCLGTRSADLWVHADDLDFTLEEPTGILYLGAPDGGYGDSPRWGPTWAGEERDATTYGGALGVRVAYRAGWATVDPYVAQAAAECVKAALDRLRTDSALKSESDGVLSWSARDVEDLCAVPPGVARGLAPFVTNRV